MNIVRTFINNPWHAFRRNSFCLTMNSILRSTNFNFYRSGSYRSSVQLRSVASKVHPKYSFQRKTKSLTADPGPGPSVEPTSINVYKHRAPKHPLFIKSKELTPDKIPGPGAHDVIEAKMKVIHQYPAYTHRWKTCDPLAERDQKPGAAEYDLTKYNPFDKSPAYTMRKKNCEYVYVPIVPFDNC